MCTVHYVEVRPSEFRETVGVRPADAMGFPQGKLFDLTLSYVDEIGIEIAYIQLRQLSSDDPEIRYYVRRDGHEAA